MLFISNYLCIIIGEGQNQNQEEKKKRRRRETRKSISIRNSRGVG